MIGIFLLLMAAGCSSDPEPGDKGTLQLEVLTPSQPGKNPYEGIFKLSFVLDQNGVPLGSNEVEFDGSSFSGGNQALPALDFELDASRWEDLRLTVTGYKLGAGAQDEAVSVGRTGRFALAGGETLGLSVYLSPVNEFSSPGDMLHPRYGHTASLLPDGRVLVVGGAYTDDPLDTGTLVTQAEIYNPDTAAFESLSSTVPGRMFHSASVLSDGRVLIYGGLGTSGVLDDAALFDPGSDAFQMLTLQPSGGPRMGHSASLLPEGLSGGGVVLIAGGASSDPIESVLGTAFRVDPDAQTTVPTQNGLVARAFHRSVETGNAMGEVVIIGGIDEQGALDGVEVYNSQDDSFGALTAGPDSRDSLLQPRVGHSAALLRDQAILVTGGNTDLSGDQTDTHLSVEVFSSDLFAMVGTGDSLPNQAREWHSATTLEDGRVLIAGGRQVSQGAVTFLDSAEVFVPDDSGSTAYYDCSFEPAFDRLTRARSMHTATRLPDGTVLLIGGLNQNGVVAEAEIYNPAEVGN